MEPTGLNFLNFTSEKELDQHIYRITKQDHVFSLFAKRENALAQTRRWKDQFENFQLTLGGMLDGESFGYSFKDDFVGQCWTRKSRSEAMWGVYANSAEERYLRIRSTPRKLLMGLIIAHPEMPQDTCFLGKVQYWKEADLKAYLNASHGLTLSPLHFARSLLIKRLPFSHESEIRLLYFGDAKKCDDKGLYRYPVDPHVMITQIMADPNRDRSHWETDKAEIKAKTGFKGDIKRSKLYDPPEWELPHFTSKGDDA